jgi:hypothetical protein
VHGDVGWYAKEPGIYLTLRNNQVLLFIRASQLRQECAKVIGKSRSREQSRGSILPSIRNMLALCCITLCLVLKATILHDYQLRPIARAIAPDKLLDVTTAFDPINTFLAAEHFWCVWDKTGKSPLD